MNVIFKLILTAAMLTAGLTASAQVGIHAGATMPYQKVTQLNPMAIGERFGLGAYAGVDYDIHIAKGFFITPGLYYNFTIAVEDGITEGLVAEERQMDHLARVPVHFKYEFNLIPDKFAISLYAGPAFSLGMASKSLIYLYASGLSLDGIYNNYSGELEDLSFSRVAGLNISNEVKKRTA